MTKYQNATFIDSNVDEILSFSKKALDDGNEFVQLCATALDDGVELLYTFKEASALDAKLFSYTVIAKDGVDVPSITDYFPAAFVFENEAHDLFGVSIKGISIDFEGDFYQVAVEFPMKKNQAVKEAQNE